MLEASVVVDVSTFKKIGSLIAGIIYLQIGQHAFPAKVWNDSIVLILSWWFDNIANGKHKFLVSGCHCLVMTLHFGRYKVGTIVNLSQIPNTF